MKIIPIIGLILLFASSIAIAEDISSTICRSNHDEIIFKKLSGPNVQILAVCPKKGLYFIEVLAEPKDISEFKENIFKSDLKITGISVYKEKTEIGSQVLMVEFEY